ncbi:MAG: HTH domain-containing protein [Haloarculaceae archaeon]
MAVFLRSLAPSIGAYSRQEAILEHLTELADRGRLEIASTTVWGRAVCPEGQSVDTGAGGRVLDRIEQFQAWATEADARIDLPVEERTVAASVTDERYRKLVLPRLCLGVSLGDDLELVLPCEVAGESFCVEEFLATFDDRAAADRSVGLSV